MPNALANLPTPVLDREVRDLESKLVLGVAEGAEIDTFMILAGELGRRMTLARGSSIVLDGILDPRD